MATVAVEVDDKTLEVVEEEERPAHLYTKWIIDQFDQFGVTPVAICGYIRVSEKKFEDWDQRKKAKFCPECFAIAMMGKL